MNPQTEQDLRQQILDQVKTYYETVHKPKNEARENGPLNYAGRVFDAEELVNLVDASLDFWLTRGRYAARFEQAFAEYLGVRYALLTNSGSSANLLALMALTSPSLGERRLLPGDEVITVAAGFPTTVAPTLQYGAVPVFIDIALPNCNIDTRRLEAALSPRTKAIMVAHTMGNPFDLENVSAFCKKHNLWLIEDNCDALGAEYHLDGEWRKTGTMGDIGSSSFYPPHHMTLGEGGCVYTNNSLLKRAIESFRDWGRDCWCPSGKDNTCGKRFNWSFGELPEGYDHKYTYSHFGFNLNVTEMQAAIGCAQLEKLPDFVEKRRRNWQTLREGLEHLSDYFIFPEATPNSRPSWFGFLMLVKPDAPFTRTELVTYLEDQQIQTRQLFAGNIIKQPCFDEMRASGEGYRVVGDLQNTDLVMNHGFWVGVYPGLTAGQLQRMIDQISTFVAQATPNVKA